MAVKHIFSVRNKRRLWQESLCAFQAGSNRCEIRFMTASSRDLSVAKWPKADIGVYSVPKLYVADAIVLKMRDKASKSTGLLLSTSQKAFSGEL